MDMPSPLSQRHCSSLLYQNFCFTRHANIVIQIFLKMNTLRNQVQLIGHLGQTPELKSFDNGVALMKAPLATNDYYKNNKGEKMQDTQWHNIIAWGKTAEYFKQAMDKGDEVAVKGKLVHRKYEDAQGNTRYVSEVVVSEFMKLGSK